MFADHGIIFAHRHFFGLGARVLFGDVKETGISGADELDLDGCWFGHGANPFSLGLVWNRTKARKRGPLRDGGAFVNPPGLIPRPKTLMHCSVRLICCGFHREVQPRITAEPMTLGYSGGVRWAGFEPGESKADPLASSPRA